MARKPPIKETSEQEARRLRDLLYGEQKDPNNWEHCSNRWINDLEWLREMTNK